MTPAVGSTICGRAVRLLPGGSALVHGREGSALVDNAVPGDELRCLVTGRRRGALRARIEEVLAPSELRRRPACAVADRCGGCALQFLAPGRHAAVKSDWVREAFSPFLDSDSEWLPASTSWPQPRRRARWWRGCDGKGSFLGFRMRGSHAPVRMPTCAMVDLELDRLRRRLETGLPGEVESVYCARLDDGLHLVFEAAEAPPQKGKALDIRSVDRGLSLPVQLWWRNGSICRPLKRPVLALHDRVPAGEGDMLLEVGPIDFLQAQRSGNEAMIKQVLAWAGSPRFVADLFSGIGNLSLPLAQARGATVRGADISASACRRAAANAARYGLNARFETLDLYAGCDLSTYAGADVLILDPPRRGARRILRMLGMLLPATVIMINCDAAAGARDARILSGHGYRLRALRALDLFPYSGHVEAMSLWRR